MMNAAFRIWRWLECRSLRPSFGWLVTVAVAVGVNVYSLARWGDPGCLSNKAATSLRCTDNLGASLLLTTVPVALFATAVFLLSVRKERRPFEGNEA
jgi:hypothetical protein